MTGATSEGDGKTESEVIDLSLDSKNQCRKWVNHPGPKIWNAIGGLIGDTPLICGGAGYGSYSFDGDECYSFKGQTSEFITKMTFPRHRAASVVIDERMLWITGGWSEINVGEAWGPSKTSEYVNLDGSIAGKVIMYIEIAQGAIFME